MSVVSRVISHWSWWTRLPGSFQSGYGLSALKSSRLVLHDDGFGVPRLPAGVGDAADQHPAMAGCRDVVGDCWTKGQLRREKPNRPVGVAKSPSVDLKVQLNLAPALGTGNKRQNWVVHAGAG